MPTPILQYLQAQELPDYGINEDVLASIPVSRQNKAILGACRLFDSYLRGQAVFPLTQVGDDVKRAVGIVAVYDLLSVRGFSGDSDADQIIVTRYDETIAWFRRIADGKAFPDITDSSSGSSEGRAAARPRAQSSRQEGWSVRGTNRRPGPFQND